MAQKPSIPKGTRDFDSAEVAKRNYIINIIKEQFQLYAFSPIETPSFENSKTLLGKYGDEGDRLIFKILNSGAYLSKVDEGTLVSKDEAKLTSLISDKALRYDLTVPFARYVVQHQNEIDFPFKRYQIQPVWRADRPQKGRFREFYQCDADVVGSDSLWQEVELIQLYDAVFTGLDLPGVKIKMNNRKILSGISEVIGAEENLIDFTVALDKLDKIGEEKVKNEMREKGIPDEAISQLQPLFELSGSFEDQIIALKSLLHSSQKGVQGIEELQFIYKSVSELGLTSAKLEIDVTLARGLDYYTGAIFEVAAPEGVQMGSIGGGGRYDDLTGIFGLKGMSGVGISFGLDRIYLVIEQLERFPPTILNSTKVLFANFRQKEAFFSLQLIRALRAEGIVTELYPEASKLKKQFNYADKRGVPFVAIIGESELEKKEVTIKEMKSGKQVTMPVNDLVAFLKP
jgi:histidyl-tRNA synthetase